MCRTKHSAVQCAPWRYPFRASGDVHRPGNSAFTLIELLVVVAIIGMLLAVLLPALRIAKRQAQGVVCSSNLKQIGMAANTYAEEYDQYIPRAELIDAQIDWNAADPFTGNWQIAFAPYIGGSGSGFRNYWEIEAYNCPSYPDREQTVDYVVNAWRYDPANLVGAERHGFMKLTAVRNRGSYVYLADYAYFGYQRDAANHLQSTGQKAGSHIRIVTPEMIQTLEPRELYLEMRWMDVWHESHLPTIPENNTHRVAYNRHKRYGANDLFLDGHVEWLASEEQTPEKWRVRE